jgi:hypothetical protein
LDNRNINLSGIFNENLILLLYQTIFGIGTCVINFPPLFIYFFSFLNISFLKFHAPKKI